jgi:hypothetical protein
MIFDPGVDDFCLMQALTKSQALHPASEQAPQLTAKRPSPREKSRHSTITVAREDMAKVAESRRLRRLMLDNAS